MVKRGSRTPQRVIHRKCFCLPPFSNDLTKRLAPECTVALPIYNPWFRAFPFYDPFLLLSLSFPTTPDQFFFSCSLRFTHEFLFSCSACAGDDDGRRFRVRRRRRRRGESLLLFLRRTLFLSYPIFSSFFVEDRRSLDRGLSQRWVRFSSSSSQNKSRGPQGTCFGCHSCPPCRFINSSMGTEWNMRHTSRFRPKLLSLHTLKHVFRRMFYSLSVHFFWITSGQFVLYSPSGCR